MWSRLAVVLTGAVVAASAQGSAPSVTLIVNASAPQELISPSLFGLNLEFTRHDIFNGLSAQLIANRLFALQPAGTTWPLPWPAGAPPRWHAIGRPSFGPAQSVTCALDATHTLCGVQQDPVQGGFASGVSFGSGIGVEAGAAYRLEVVAAASSTGAATLPLQVQLLGVFETTLDVPTTTAWTQFSYDFVAPTTLPTTSLLITAAGSSGTVTLNATSLLPLNGRTAAEYGSLRSDVVEALRSLNFTGPLRYPGGCFAPFSRWRDLLQPLLTRPPVLTPPGYCTAVAGGVNAYADGFEQDGPGIDEYVQLTRSLGLTLSMTVALQFGTAAEIQSAADLVQYVNGNSSTPLGALRAARGFPQPYNVTLWYLGNEMNMQQRYQDYPANLQPSGPPSAADYAGYVTALSAAMLAQDPTIHLLAVEGGAGWDAAWAQSAAGGSIYATSYHGGYATSGPGGSPQSPADFTSQAKIPDGPFLNGLQALRGTLDGLGVNGSRVVVSADEFGLGPPWDVQSFNTAHALYAASFYHVILNNAAANRVEFSNYFEPINEGAITVNQFNASLTPLGVVMPLFSRYGGCTRLPAPAPAPGTPTDTDVITLAAITPGPASAVLLTLSNRNSTTAFTQPVTLLPVSGSNGYGATATVTVLAASDLTPQSVFVQSSLTVPVSPDGSFTLTLPAYSVVQVSIPIVGAADYA